VGCYCVAAAACIVCWHGPPFQHAALSYLCYNAHCVNNTLLLLLLLLLPALLPAVAKTSAATS
jgi:hypothetical protein